MGLIMQGVGTRGVATIYPDTNLVLSAGAGGQIGGSSNSFTLVNPMKVGDLVLLISSAPNVSQAVWDSALLTEVTDQGSQPNLNIQHSLVAANDSLGRYAGPTRDGFNVIITPNIIPLQLFYRKAVFDQTGTRTAVIFDNNPVTVTGLTTTVDNCKLLLVIASSAGGVTPATPPAGWELEIDSLPGIFSGRLIVFKRIQAQAGATGSAVFDGQFGTGARTVGIMLSIKPPVVVVPAIITGTVTVATFTAAPNTYYGYNFGGANVDITPTYASAPFRSSYSTGPYSVALWYASTSDAQYIAAAAASTLKTVSFIFSGTEYRGIISAVSTSSNTFYGPTAYVVTYTLSGPAVGWTLPASAGAPSDSPWTLISTRGAITTNPASIIAALEYVPGSSGTQVALNGGSYTGPQGAVTVVAGSTINGSSTFTLTVGGISAQITLDVMGTYITGDPFNLSGRSGQTLAISITTP